MELIMSVAMIKPNDESSYALDVTIIEQISPIKLKDVMKREYSDKWRSKTQEFVGYLTDSMKEFDEFKSTVDDSAETRRDLAEKLIGDNGEMVAKVRSKMRE